MCHFSAWICKKRIIGKILNIAHNYMKITIVESTIKPPKHLTIERWVIFLIPWHLPLYDIKNLIIFQKRMYFISLFNMQWQSDQYVHVSKKLAVLIRCLVFSIRTWCRMFIGPFSRKVFHTCRHLHPNLKKNVNYIIYML